ncbi:MAG: Hsp33 family molecular chaperone [Beijerinckiaceae bacterium]
MSDIRIAEMHVGDGPGVDDFLLPFQVDKLDVRGRVLRLGPAIDTLLKRHAYPAPVSRLVAEAATLTVLLGSALKLDGRFQMQTKSDGPVSMLVVDFDAPNRIRAYAQFDAAGVAPDAASAALLGKGHLALTIDQGGNMNRYQGVVPLDGHGLEAAAHQYFRQSEQIPTRIRLSVGEVTAPGGTRWRAGGLFLQFLPEAPERMRQGDLHPGDAPEGGRIYEFKEDNSWTEAKVLADTVEDHELLDPGLSAEQLLYRLFHEPGVRVFEGQTIVEACRCSQERILGMLRRFSDQERRDMIGEDGKIAVTCEFCSTHYVVAPDDAAPR